MKIYYFFAISVLIIIFVVTEIRKSKLSVKDSLFWIIGAFCIFLLSLFPGVINKTASFFGVSYPPTILFVFVLLILMYILFKNNKIITEQQEKINELAEQLALLNDKIKKIK